MGPIKIKVRYFSFFQDIAGKAEEYILVKELTVGGLIDLLEKKYRSKAGNASLHLKSANNRTEFMIFVNGKLSDMECSLKDGDEVSLIQPMGGG